MSGELIKRPASITLLGLLSLLCGLSFILPVAIIGAAAALTDSGRLLSQLSATFQVSAGEVRIGALVLVSQMLILVLISSGLFWRWKLAWYLLAGFVLDGAVIPLLMLVLGSSSASVFTTGLIVINSLACLMVVRWLLRKDICRWFGMTADLSPRFALYLLAAVLANLPLYYMSRFMTPV